MQLDDDDFEKLGKLITAALTKQLDPIRKQQDRFEQRFAAIEQRLMNVEQRLTFVEQRLTLVERGVAELRGVVAQLAARQQEQSTTLAMIWDSLRGIYSREQRQDERLDAVEQALKRPPPAAQP